MKKRGRFNYCVGRPWPKDAVANQDGKAIGCYTLGGEVKYGTIKDAEAFRQYVNQQTGQEYFIYKVVPLES